MGFEPMRLSPQEPSSCSLTTRTSALEEYNNSCGEYLKSWFYSIQYHKNKGLRGMGFEPMQLSLTDLETVALTTRPSSLYDSIKSCSEVVLGIEPRLQESKSCVLTIIRYNQRILFKVKKQTQRGRTRDRTEITRVRVLCTYHYTMQPEVVPFET